MATVSAAHLAVYARRSFQVFLVFIHRRTNRPGACWRRWAWHSTAALRDSKNPSRGSRRDGRTPWDRRHRSCWSVPLGGATENERFWQQLIFYLCVCMCYCDRERIGYLNMPRVCRGIFRDLKGSLKFGGSYLHMDVCIMLIEREQNGSIDIINLMVFIKKKYINIQDFVII